MNNKNNEYKKFEVTFTENKKYLPNTRTVTVHAINEYHATMLAHEHFGSISKVTATGVIPSNKIKIEKVVMLEDKHGKENKEITIGEKAVSV